MGRKRGKGRKRRRKKGKKEKEGRKSRRKRSRRGKKKKKEGYIKKCDVSSDISTCKTKKKQNRFFKSKSKNKEIK
jgi:hypothetical protein